VDLPSCGVATKFANMEYQMLTYFDKFTFSDLLFPQVVISYLSSTLCQNARFPTPLCQILNSTLSNCQLHIASDTLPTCQIDFIFWAAPIFTLTLKTFNILPNLIYESNSGVCLSVWTKLQVSRNEVSQP
jgi:hypothetical protein